MPYRRFDDRQRDTQDARRGLGLALVAQQAQLLGHALVVRSRPGRGSFKPADPGGRGGRRGASFALEMR